MEKVPQVGPRCDSGKASVKPPNVRDEKEKFNERGSLSFAKAQSTHVDNALVGCLLGAL